jgi:Ca2+-binding RTX toxin-like protein
MIGTVRYVALVCALIAACVAVVAPSTASARAQCFGHKATIAGNARGNHIKGTGHKDVIAGLGGRDVIISNGGRDLICGGPGSDRIIGGSHPSRLRRDDRSKLIGGAGNDYILGGYDNDLIIGDNANLSGDAIGHVGKDELDGDFGRDYMVGDNYSRFDAKGGKHDVLLGQKQNDTLIGDSAVTRGGTARGGGNDHFESMSDKDFEVGDSYSPFGKAAGGGKDTINAGPQRDFIVGDSYTKTGLATGSGRDHIHARSGPDTAYGDNYAAKPHGRTSDGAHDSIGGAGGIDHLFGGPARDICNGGKGHRDRARHCEYVLRVP